MTGSRRKLTLTFDNGPDSDVTPRVLEDLKQRNLPAVFFPVGERLESLEHRALLRRVADNGHRIGNHTYSHPRPFGALTPEAAIAEIERTDSLLSGMNEPDRMFRPSAGGGVVRPGVLNQGLVDYLVESQHTLVMWSVICEDWSRPDGSWIDLAMPQILEQSWSLIVLHDIAMGGMAHLPAFLDRVAEADVEVVAELPPEHVPIVRGHIAHPVDHLV